MYVTLDLALDSKIQHQEHKQQELDKTYASKDSYQQSKKTMHEWKKTFANHIAHKGLLPKICKEFLQLKKLKV